MTPAKLKSQDPPTKTADTEANEALEFVAGLSSAARSKLASMGCVIPNLQGGTTAIKFAYRCSNCGHAALYFVGEVFDNGQGGTVDRPPTGVPIDQIPWKQDKAPHEIDRMRPTCQHCSHGVALDGRALRQKLIVVWGDYVASRTAAVKAVEEARRRRATSTLAEGARGGSIPTDPLTASLKTGKLSEHYPLSDDAKRDVQALEAAGLTGGLQRA